MPSESKTGPRKRTSLSNLGGEVNAYGDPAFSVPLTMALEAQAEEADAYTHGFHAYPARMHPMVAHSILKDLSPGVGATVLDPFCGSGTVAVEAMLAGWRSLGSDLDPLALKLARVKTQRRNTASRRAFLEDLEAVGRASEERVRERVPVRAQLPPAELAWYEVHVLKEMAGLLEEIRKVGNEADRMALEMVFSSLVVKFSRQRSETVQKVEPKRIRKGLVSEFFVRKGQELVRRWEALERALPPKSHRPRFLLSDARALPHTISGEFRCDLILCSPPYGGTYDYLTHHSRRHAWFGINPKGLRQSEIGARRHLGRQAVEATQAAQMGSKKKKKAESPMQRWNGQVSEVLTAMAKLLKPEGVAVLR